MNFKLGGCNEKIKISFHSPQPPVPSPTFRTRFMKIINIRRFQSWVCALIGSVILISSFFTGEAIAAPSTQHNNAVLTKILAEKNCCDPEKEYCTDDKDDLPICQNFSQIRQQAPTLVAKQ